MAAIKYYAGSGFKETGKYCEYDPVADNCKTDGVIYVSGSGLKEYSSITAVNSTCPSNVVTYVSGSGFKTLATQRCMAIA